MSGCNPLVLHMFIACGGLSVLTTLLETNYNAFKTLIQATIRSIWNIFHIQVRTPTPARALSVSLCYVRVPADTCHPWYRSCPRTIFAICLANVD